jgi:hypothetical protein
LSLTTFFSSFCRCDCFLATSVLVLGKSFCCCHVFFGCLGVSHSS